VAGELCSFRYSAIRRLRFRFDCVAIVPTLAIRAACSSAAVPRSQGAWSASRVSNSAIHWLACSFAASGPPSRPIAFSSSSGRVPVASVGWIQPSVNFVMRSMIWAPVP
jgi:hypothetical protein